MTLKEYFSKEKHTRKEKKWFNKVMQQKYTNYKEEYHRAKIKYRKHTVEKLTFSDYKKLYEREYEENLSKLGAPGYKTEASIGAKTTLKFLDEEKLRTLSDHSYRVKLENFKKNQAEYRRKYEGGMPLTEGETLILNYKLPFGEISMDEIINLVNYFERLGFGNTAFDS